MDSFSLSTTTGAFVAITERLDLLACIAFATALLVLSFSINHDGNA